MVKFVSALGTGPLYHKTYYYDILVLKKHCEFVMEYCRVPKLGGNIIQRMTIEKDLISNLAIMHSFKAVHMDIKPENVAYSPHFKKFVFVDFGFA